MRAASGTPVAFPLQNVNLLTSLLHCTVVWGYICQRGRDGGGRVIRKLPPPSRYSINEKHVNNDNRLYSVDNVTRGTFYASHSADCKDKRDVYYTNAARKIYLIFSQRL